MRCNYLTLENMVKRKICYGIVQPGQSVTDGIPVIKVNNLISGLKSLSELDTTTRENEAKYIRTRLHGGELIISVVGTIGKTAIVPKSFAGCNLVRATALIDIEDALLSKWVKYYIDSPYGQSYIEQNLNTTVQPTLNIRSLEKMSIPLYDAEYMKKIVILLSSLDEKIAINREINDNLEQQVSALYQSWFEDFEPSNGICPEHWSYQELSTIANIVSGKRPPIKSEVCNQETSIPIVGAASIMGFTSQSNHTDKILVTGRVGTHGVVQRFNVPCWTSDNTLVITSPFYEFTNQILCRIDYSSMNRGSTQPLITQGDMKKVIVLIPDEKTLAKFEEFAGSLMAKWEANNHENIQLALLRDSLLPKLMSGEIDVSAIQL